MFAKECFAHGFIGADFDIAEDLTGRLPDEWRAFNKEFIPIYLKIHPQKNRISAGLACGALWTIAKYLKNGDYVLSPNGAGAYHVGEIVGGYTYAPNQILPHRRPVRWLDPLIERSAMSEALQNSTGSIGPVSDVTKYGEEIARLLGASDAPAIVTSDPTIEDPVAFALEKHLEDFLVKNWAQTELGRKYDIFEEDGEDGEYGQQYRTDTGPIDILAVSKDKKELLVVELKKGRASDVVVGQTLRYMGFVLQELAESDQVVRGTIIALEDDQALRRALAACSNVDFYRYQVSFKLLRA